MMNPLQQKKPGTEHWYEKPFFVTFIPIAQFIIAVGGLVLFINFFLIQSYIVNGSSMADTLHNNDRLIISKLGKSWSNITGSAYLPSRGEIVVFHDPSGSDRQLIKRVIGLPGERITLRSGELTIYNEFSPNGFDPDVEFDINTYTNGEEFDITIPEGHLFVVGDNRNPGGSSDSRNSFGPVDNQYLVGKLILRVLPLSDAKFFK